MKAREAFDRIRNQKSSKFNLNFRFTTMISAELTITILLAYGASILLNRTFPFVERIPDFVKMLIISLAVSLVSTYFISKWVWDPLKKLRQGMEKVADGDFSTRIDTKSSSKEIQEVYSGFNLMVHELNATEMLQNDFVSNVSHEIKTPIAAIEGYSTLLQDNDSINEEQRECIDKILLNTKRLSSLIGNILLLSKIENQSIETHQTWYRLDEQIRESIVTMEPLWSKKEIDFDVDLDSVKYFGNENLLIHVWNNLLSNAIKFSPQEGEVRLRLFRQDGKIIFTIEDHGPGIPEESQKHIFDKFYQADSSHKQEGNGLGLPLVMRILMITGGEISVANNTDSGCTFTVTLDELRKDRLA